MPRNRFVDPTATTRLSLSDGDWLEVKNNITWGEDMRLLALNLAATGGRTEVTLGDIGGQWNHYKLTQVTIWVVEWSFVDAAGKAVPFTYEALGEVDRETGDEILNALDQHWQAQRESPKVKNGAKPSAGVSP